MIERAIELRDVAHDDELTDELDNAVTHLEYASDRLIAMEEEEWDDEADEDDEASEDDPQDDGDYAYDTWKDDQLTG